MNRRCFLEHVDRAFARPSCAEQRLGMLYIAVDDVEGLRRELGTVCFRALASELARRVQGVAAADDTVAYFGNGILTLLGQRREPAGLGGLAHAVLTAFTAEPVSACGRSVRVGCSIGVAAPAGRLRNGTSLLTRAEHAAAVAQERGGSQVCEYVEADDAQAGADDAGETDSRIARAVEARAFRLAYQPIISLHGEHEQMYEAFLRLLDEQGSVLLPAAFLAQFRGATQMVEVDRWVIEHAIETLAADRHTRGRTRFFIKLSRQALGARMLPMWISNCIRNSRLIGQDRIVFEAAEPDIARDLDGAARLVQALRELHCGFAVEHFATSSETDAILARLRPEYVKLQGDAVHGVGADAAVTARVGAWIDTATAAGATPIVAQVEDTNTLAALWEMGVRYFQGHAVQPPGNRLDFDFQNAPAFAPGAD